jgi:glycosyltransferase involved in cell wall biosynthesis
MPGPAEEKPLLVSVLVPSYNYGRYLGAALESIGRQSYSHWEIVAVDDGSTDDSVEVLREYKKRSGGKLRVLAHPGGTHQGLVPTYQRALAAAQGGVVAFLEADDVWHPENLRRKVEILNRYPDVGVVYSDYLAFGDRKASAFWYLYGAIRRWETPARVPCRMLRPFLLRNPVASFSHFIVRRELLGDMPGPGSHFRNYDWWVLAHLAAQTSFYFLPEKLSFWRIHRGSAWHRRHDRKTTVRLLSFLLKLYKSLLSGSAAESGEAEKLAQAERKACSFRSSLSERKFFKLAAQMALAYPIDSVRFWGHVLLRNLLLGGRA